MRDDWVARVSAAGCVAFVVSVALVSPGIAASRGAPYSLRATSACLAGKHVLASSVPKAQAVPGSIPAVNVLGFSFALVPQEALNHGVIIYESSSKAAMGASAKLLTFFVAQAARVQGISLAKARELIASSLQVRGNAIIEWENHPTSYGARRTVWACLK